MFLLTIIAEVGFLIADGVGINKFGILNRFSAGSCSYYYYDYTPGIGTVYSLDQCYLGADAIYILLIVQIVMVFVVPVVGPVIVGLIAISVISGSANWGNLEDLEDRYDLPSSSWTEVDHCMYQNFQNSLCASYGYDGRAKSLLEDFIDLAEIEKEEFAKVIMSQVPQNGHSKKLATRELSSRPRTFNLTLAKLAEYYPYGPENPELSGGSSWKALMTYLEGTSWGCLVTSGSAFERLYEFKQTPAALLEKQFGIKVTGWTNAYDTLGSKLCKKPLTAQRTFVSFAIIGAIGLLVMSFVGCCYCPVLDEKLPTININIPGAGLARDTKNENTDAAEA